MAATYSIKTRSPIFGELDAVLHRTSGLESLELGVVGGAALVLQWGLRATYDVDFITDDVPAAVRRSAGEIARRRGIQTDWLNDAAKGFTPDLPFIGVVVFGVPVANGQDPTLQGLEDGRLTAIGH